MNLYPATAFIRHLLTSRSVAGHGVHSPFVFDFLTDVVSGKNDADIIGEVERLRQEMLADRRTVRVTDLGAGSARGLGEERSIRDVASLAALPPRHVALLSRIAASMRERLHCGLNHVVQLDAGDREPNIPGVPACGTHPDNQGADQGTIDRIEPVNAGRREPGKSETSRTGEIHKKVTGGRDDEAGGMEQGPEHTRSEAAQSLESGRGQGSGLSAYKEHSDAVPRKRESSEQASDNSIILELGTSLGISTLALSLAAPEKRVVTVEGCPALAELARDNLLRHGIANTDVINMEFSEALDLLRHRGTIVSLAFIDGNHRGGALKQYAETIRSMGEEMLIVADDIHLSRDMHAAWQQLVVSGIAPATLETYRFGILFCLHNLTPGHYRIRH